MTRPRAPERQQGRVLVMGIVNRTPDSFFDGGRHLGDDTGLARVDELMRAGADVIDVGAESTRPGARAVPAAEQIARLGEVIGYAARRGAVVSIDTTLPEVAEFALAQGAAMVNSIALEPAAELAEVAARYQAALALTHCRGAMSGMPGFSEWPADAYGDVVADVAREWSAAAERAMAAGLPKRRVWLDPGLGFTKNAAQSLALCARLGELARLGHPILVGPSRKSFVAAAVARGAVPPPAERLGGSLAAALDCARRGADMLRVHDVAEVAQALAYENTIVSMEVSCSRG